MPRWLRIVLILAVGLSLIGYILYQDRWGSLVPLDDWGDLDVHSFGEGDTAIVILHGYGSSPADVSILAKLLSETVPARYVLPRGPHHVDGGGWAWFLWPDEAGSHEAHLRSIVASRTKLIALIGRARREGATRVILMGHSMGSRMAGDVGLSIEPPVDAIGLLSGSTLPTWQASRLSGQQIFMSHGTHDPIFPMHHAEEILASLREHGAEVTWAPYDGGHGFGPAVEPLRAFLSAPP